MVLVSPICLFCFNGIATPQGHRIVRIEAAPFELKLWELDTETLSYSKGFVQICRGIGKGYSSKPRYLPKTFYIKTLNAPSGLLKSEAILRKEQISNLKNTKPSQDVKALALNKLATNLEFNPRFTCKQEFGY